MRRRVRLETGLMTVLRASDETIRALKARVAELEQIIIEADAQYNTDRKPADIESASLFLVRMCSYGREAMDRVAELEAEIKNRFVSFMGKPFSYWVALQAHAEALNYPELIERIAELESEIEHLKNPRHMEHCGGTGTVDDGDAMRDTKLSDQEIRAKWKEICTADRKKNCIIDSGAFAIELIRWVEQKRRQPHPQPTKSEEES